MNAMRRCLLDLDVAGVRALWAKQAPHLPQPKDDAEALVAVHVARTEARTLPLDARAYSHRWLVERGYPSRLPDKFKPRAERLYPQVVEGVGIVVAAASDVTKPILGEVRRAMSDAVEDCYAGSRKPEPEQVRRSMTNARVATVRGLLGIKS